MTNDILTADDFFDYSNFEHAALFEADTWVWHCLTNLNTYLDTWFINQPRNLSNDISKTAQFHGNQISIGKGTIIEDGVSIYGPTIIGKNCEIRQGAYIRGNTIIGDDAIVGHASEIKNSILLDGAKAPHFAYVGDSVLGNQVNLGAGSKLSNLTVSSEKDSSGKRPTIKLLIDGDLIDTGLSKLGAIIGDFAQIGCNAVTNPGTLIGKNTLVYPNLSLSKGYYGNNRILKLRQEIEAVPRR